MTTVTKGKKVTAKADQPPLSRAQEQAELGSLRDQIDQLDKDIQSLINQRARCAQAVAEVKQRSEGEPVYYRPEREAQVLRNVMARNEGPLGDEAMARLFREIMSACLALEMPMQIAYLGPAGTFTQAAALKHFGHAVHTHPFAAIDEVFREVEAGSVHYGVVPIENSTEGMVNHTLDMFMDSGLKISGEVQLRIHHHFLTASATSGDIQAIYSHQQSLAQCRRWLDSHYPGVERIAVKSNAEAARRAADEPHAAAIAGEMAAELYGLSAQAKNIEDQPDNTTRFLIIGKQPVPPSGQDKTSILVAMKNHPGALYHLLEPFHKGGISLTRLETRPSRSGTWAYVFYIDFEGHIDDAAVQAVLAKIEPEAVELKHLGSYPVGVL